MADIAFARPRARRHAFLWRRYRLRSQFARIRRAWAYAFGGLSRDSAQTLMLDCRDAAGWHPLLILTVDDTLKQARETYADHPDLPGLIAAACSRVAAKWEDYSDALHMAQEWAIEVAEGYARQDGVALVRWDDITPPGVDTSAA